MNIKKVGKILGGVVIGVGAVAAAPFTGGGSLLAGAAALGLGTTAAVVGAVVAGAAGGVLGATLLNNKDKITICLLGMKGSGKTTFLNNLREINSKLGTENKKYDSFSLKLKNGKTITINKGEDIGGGKNFMTDYKSLIKESDVVFYFFQINKYIEDIDYKRECNSRLSFIKDDIEGKKIILIASHSDHSNLSKINLFDEIENLVKGKNYSNLFGNNFNVTNLTSKEDFDLLIQKIFA